jgi:hypothetical protein
MIRDIRPRQVRLVHERRWWWLFSFYFRLPLFRLVLAHPWRVGVRLHRRLLHKQALQHRSGDILVMLLCFKFEFVHFVGPGPEGCQPAGAYNLNGLEHYR